MQTACSHSAILSFSPQGCTNISAVVSANTNGTPYISLSGYTQPFLIVDRTIVCEEPLFNDIPFTLMSAFFLFSRCYPKGCTNLFSFMEIISLKNPSDRASATVKHFLTSLKNVNWTVIALAFYIEFIFLWFCSLSCSIVHAERTQYPNSRVIITLYSGPDIQLQVCEYTWLSVCTHYFQCVFALWCVLWTPKWCVQRRCAKHT